MATRITNSSMTRTYLGNMRKNLKGLTGSNQKLSTQRSFSKASENVTDASRALRVRKLMNDNERFSDSAAGLSKKLDTIDSSMQEMSSIYNDITNLVMQASNDTMSDTDREVIANQIDKLRDEALNIANTKYGNEYIFSAAGNADNSAPFSVNADGKLCFNGNTTPVDEMVKDANGNPATDNKDGTTTEISYNGTNYLDIGLGISGSNEGGTITVDTKTMVRSSYSGVELFGYGTDENGYPTNFYGLFSSLSDSIRSGNGISMAEGLEALSESHNQLLIAVAEVGSDNVFLEDITDQLAEDETSLKELQNDIESIDIAEEIMYNAEYEMAWTVTLQIGGNLLPQSIFDFLR